MLKNQSKEIIKKNIYDCPFTDKVKNKKERLGIFLNFIDEKYSQPMCELTFKNDYELLCATILSAQCTDKQVNKVTPALFDRYPGVQDLALASSKEVEGLIRSTGFYKNKAKNLIGMASAVVINYNGKIPSDIDLLTKLPGVGRKTANVLRGNIYRIPSVVVDTHMIRINNRLGFVKSEDPVKIESELEKLLPKKRWIDFSHQVILFGRETCSAKNPSCDNCPLYKIV